MMWEALDHRAKQEALRGGAGGGQDGMRWWGIWVVGGENRGEVGRLGSCDI